MDEELSELSSSFDGSSSDYKKEYVSQTSRTDSLGSYYADLSSSEDECEAAPGPRCKHDVKFDLTKPPSQTELVSLHGSKQNIPCTLNFNLNYSPKEPYLPYVLCALEEGRMSDLSVKIGNIDFYCNFSLLRCHSPYFKKMSTRMRSISISKKRISCLTFAEIYQLLLGKHIEFSKLDLFEFFAGVKFLRIQWLINRCWLLLDQNYFELDAFLGAQKATEFGLNKLSSLLMPNRISKSFLKIVSREVFLELPCKEVCKLLSSNTIGVNTELEVLMSAIRWINYDWEHRMDHAEEVMKCIRYGLLSPITLQFLRKEPLNDCVERVMNHPKVCELIRRNMSIYRRKPKKVNIAKRSYIPSKEGTSSESDSDVAIVSGRQWIYDMRCSYHHLPHCDAPILKGISYDAFLRYLLVLREDQPSSENEIFYVRLIPDNSTCQCGFHKIMKQRLECEATKDK